MLPTKFNLKFNPNEPLLRCKQAEMDVQDLRGLLKIHIKIRNYTLFSALYTRVDQAILLWAILSLLIFGTAQFWPISWHTQAIAWSVLTLLGVVGMQCLTYFWTTVERLSWVLWSWAILMVLGLLITDAGIFGGIGWILINLCPLWLGISSLGYFLTGWGLRSRTFMLAGTIHLAGIEMLNLVPGWTFLATGLIMAGTLWLLSELQWDMRMPVEPVVLTVEERVFNQQQRQLRESNSTSQL
jgi:hypothetical protein